MTPDPIHQGSDLDSYYIDPTGQYVCAGCGFRIEHFDAIQHHLEQVAHEALLHRLGLVPTIKGGLL